MQVVLVMFRGDGERRSFSVVRNMTMIGRREDCDLRIPLGDVSRKHCRLVRTDEGIRIEDLGSSHGTTVNGQVVREMELNAGDTIGIGPVSFVVQIDGVPADDDIISPERRAAEAAVAADDSAAGIPHGAMAEEDEFPLDELSEDQVSLEEAPLEEAELEEAPLESAELEEAPLEEVPLEEEAALEEAPLEEAPLEEVPLEEEVPAGELSLEEHPLEEVPLEEVTEHAPVAADGADGMTLEEVPMEELSGSDDKTVDHTAAEAGITEAIEMPAAIPSAGEDDVEDLDWMEETPAAAPPPPALPPSLAAVAPAPPVPPAAVDPEADMEFDLDDATEEVAHAPAMPGAHGEPAPSEAAPAADGEWDFVVEETEAEHTHDEMHIDFEESHHGQPHA
jgi:pSer/pThr/pTyr-binding forkhead associated (FHA) protein